MAKAKTTQTTTIPGRSPQEALLIRLLTRIAQGGAGQLGDLSKLAQGQVGGPSAQDIELIASSIGRASELAQQQQKIVGAQIGAQSREDLLARGIPEASAEVVNTILNALGTQGQIGQSILAAQQQGGEALINLPFQRGQMQLHANQELFNRIIGAAQPTLATLLQERAAQPTTTQSQSGFDLNTITQLGSLITAIPSGGGSLLGRLNRPVATPAIPNTSSLYGRFQRGLQYRG